MAGSVRIVAWVLVNCGISPKGAALNDFKGRA